MKRIVLAALLVAVPALAQTEVSVVTHSTVVSAIPTITATPYATGDLVGNKLSLSNAVRGADVDGETSYTGLIQSVQVTDLDVQLVPLSIIFFDADPSGTTFTDNAALDIADADLVKIAGVVELTSSSAYADNGMMYARNVALPFKLTSATTLYAAIVARGAPTYSAGGLKLKVGIIQD